MNRHVTIEFPSGVLVHTKDMLCPVCNSPLRIQEINMDASEPRAVLDMHWMEVPSRSLSEVKPKHKVDLKCISELCTVELILSGEIINYDE